MPEGRGSLNNIVQDSPALPFAQIFETFPSFYARNSKLMRIFAPNIVLIQPIYSLFIN
jgi:hypothetical protein